MLGLALCPLDTLDDVLEEGVIGGVTEAKFKMA